MSEHLSTPQFLARLNRDQLARCVELANERLLRLAEVSKERYWQLADDYLVHFAHRDYAAVVARLVVLAEKRGGEWHITEERMHADELAEHLAGFK